MFRIILYFFSCVLVRTMELDDGNAQAELETPLCKAGWMVVGVREGEMVKEEVKEEVEERVVEEVNEKVEEVVVEKEEEEEKPVLSEEGAECRVSFFSGKTIIDAGMI